MTLKKFGAQDRYKSFLEGYFSIWTPSPTITACSSRRAIKTFFDNLKLLISRIDIDLSTQDVLFSVEVAKASGITDAINKNINRYFINRPLLIILKLTIIQLSILSWEVACSVQWLKKLLNINQEIEMKRKSKMFLFIIKNILFTD